MIFGMMKLAMNRNMLGVLIGFASGFHISSSLFNKIISSSSFANDLDYTGLILVYSFIITSFSIFGINCLSENYKLINGGK